MRRLPLSAAHSRAAAAANRREAVQNVQEMFAGAGYKDCSVQHYMPAATGTRQ
jgi:hypothetical protein